MFFIYIANLLCQISAGRNAIAAWIMERFFANPQSMILLYYTEVMGGGQGRWLWRTLTTENMDPASHNLLCYAAEQVSVDLFNI